jgi:hypothetical protein
MGLTIHFDLGLSATTPRDEVVDRLDKLRSAATFLSFAHVGPLVSTSAGETLGGGDDPDVQLERWFRLGAWLQNELGGGSFDGAGESLPDAIGFAVAVGADSEPATFGLAWLPPRDEHFNTLYHEPPVWRWHCACKTQFASNHGDEHFLHCHTTLIALLDKAVELGFQVEVSDEGDYWETRDVSDLLAQVHLMSRIIARMAGAMHDAIGHEHKVDSPIFDRRDFEHLEMEE